MSYLPWPLREAWLSRCVARAQAGDREAFRRLYRALYGPVSAYVGRRVRRREDAEDIVGQVFFRLLESLGRVDTRRGTVLAYVLSMARNALADEARRGHLAAPEEVLAALPDPAGSPLERLESREESAAVRAELAALPAETRELLVLRYADGLRYAEIAQMVGLSEAAVRQRTSRAVRDIRARWSARSAGGALSNES
jgi:RNA polymerase sigma-70 factor (ECF subfamily)